MALRAPLDLQLEGVAERVRRSQSDAIKELQTQPFATAVIKRNIAIPASGTVVSVAHGLGRAPQMVIVSPPRMADTTGQTTGAVFDINETRRSGDRTRVVAFQGIGFTLDVVVDITFL